MRTLIRDPLLHFLFFAMLLLGVDAILKTYRKPVVEITPADFQAEVELNADILGRPLAGDEKNRLVREMLENEILFREAQKRGMVTDNHVRETLIAMMRSTFKPVSASATDVDLKAILATLPRENTTLPEQIAFEHVSFPSAEQAPADLLEKLRRGTDPKTFGDPLRIANPFPPTYRPQVERLLGGDFAQGVFAQPIGEWVGPISSNRGFHYVRVTAREPERPLPMEQIRPMLEARWIKQQENTAVAREVDRLATGYQIILPPSAHTADAGK